MSNIFPQVEAFRDKLQKLGKDYICNTILPDKVVYVSFIGPLHGRVVLWDMTLASLAHFRGRDSGNTPAKISVLHPCPFIEIKEGHEGVYALKVGLDLEIIDEPVIKKTIIMIRNYKLLDVGLIEFGRMHT
jgi:hypothetical protein